MSVRTGIVEDAREQGATIATGGKVMDGAGNGYFYEPTIISDVKEGARIVDEEQFGPVLPIIKYSDDEEALARANDSDLGLGGSVWTKDIAVGNNLANRIESGCVQQRPVTTLSSDADRCCRQDGLGEPAPDDDWRALRWLQELRPRA